MPEKLQVVVDGTYVSALMPWGDLEWSTVWPGGSESLQFGVARAHRLFRPDALVELYHGGECLWCGLMLDPTRGEALVAEGLFRKAEDEPALTAADEVATSVHEAIDQAILRGLQWATRINDLSPVSGVRGMPYLDPDQPHSLKEFLDQSAIEREQEWGVDPDRNVHLASWPTTATMHMLPGVDGLGISRDGYASTLYGRYLDSTTGLYKTVKRTDAVAEKRWGRVPHTITEPLGEGQSMPAVDAQTILAGLLAQGASQIGWTKPIDVEFGDVVNEYNQPIALHKITAGEVLTLHGLIDNVADLDGSTRTNMPIRRVHHKGRMATIEPRGLSEPANDVDAGVLA